MPELKAQIGYLDNRVIGQKHTVAGQGIGSEPEDPRAGVVNPLIHQKPPADDKTFQLDGIDFPISQAIFSDFLPNLSSFSLMA